MKKLIIFLISFFLLSSNIYASLLGDSDIPLKCKVILDKKSKELCIEEYKLDVKKKERELEIKRRSFDNPGVKNQNITVLGGSGIFGSDSAKDKKVSLQESKIEFGVDLPISIYMSDLHGTAQYNFDTVFDNLIFQYNIDRGIHLTYQYNKRKISLQKKYSDTETSYYEATHHIISFGVRSMLSEKWQGVFDIGLSNSEVKPDEGDDLTLDYGLYFDFKVLYIVNNIKVGPVFSALKVQSTETDKLSENYKAGFTKVGLTFQFGLPDVFGSVR